MKRKILDFSVMKEKISQNNVLEMAELIAFTELRFQIGYQGSRIQKMYADLYADIKHKNELGYMLSDSYDLVQEGALYLCEHYGKHLNDVIGYNKKGKQITIEIACAKIVESLQVYFTNKPDALGNSVALQPVELTVNVLFCGFGVGEILFHTVVNILFTLTLFKTITFFIQFVEQLLSGHFRVIVGVEISLIGGLSFCFKHSPKSTSLVSPSAANAVSASRFSVFNCCFCNVSSTTSITSSGR